MTYPDSIPEVDAESLFRRLQSGENFTLLDVREVWELERASINDDRLRVAPMSYLSQAGLDALPKEVRAKDAGILVLCHHGIRSARVTRWLRAQGWINIFSVRGGIAEYARRVDGSVGKY